MSNVPESRVFTFSVLFSEAWITKPVGYFSLFNVFYKDLVHCTELTVMFFRFLISL